MMGVIHVLCVAAYIVSSYAETQTQEPTVDTPITRSPARYHGRVSRYEIMRINQMLIKNMISQARLQEKQESMQSRFQEKQETMVKKINACESLNSQLEKQESEIKLLNRKLADQEQKFSAIQIANIKLNHQIDILNTKLTHQVEKETRAHATTADIKTDVSALEQSFKKMTEQLTGISEEINDKATVIEKSLDKMESDQKTKNVQIDTSLAEIKASSQKTKIRFNARNEANVDYTSGQIMVFNVATINDGRGYSPITGVFTAPTEGTYMFLTNLMREQTTHFGIYHNNVRVSWAYSGLGSGSQHFGAQAMIELKKDDVVHVKIDAGRIDGGHYSYKTNTFQGYLMD